MNLPLHPEHGVNPTVAVCFFCGKDTGEVALLGNAYKGEAPHRMVLNYEPCATCADHMKQGVMLISVIPGESGNNPERTGHMVVVRDEFITRVMEEPLASEIIKRRVAFVPDDAWVRLGLPTDAPEA